MANWTIYGIVMIDDLNLNAYVKVQAAVPSTDGEGTALSNTVLQVYVDVPPTGVLTSMDAKLGYDALKPFQNAKISLVGVAPGGGLLLIQPAGEER